MTKHEIEEAVNQGRCTLSIELDPSRIQAVLAAPDSTPIAAGEHSWENQGGNGILTDSMEDVWDGLRDAYRNLFNDVESRYSQKLCRLSAVNLSAISPGCLPLGADGEPLAPFCAWQNPVTEQDAVELAARFSLAPPQHWTIAHLYQAMLNGEEHVKDITYLTTLSGYLHYKLTGRKVLDTGEAGGLFPIDGAAGDYDQTMVSSFDSLAAERGYPWRLRDILPRVLSAGEYAGTLTEAGVKLLDPLQNLKPGIPLAPPEGVLENFSAEQIFTGQQTVTAEPR